jgi:general secretion pathway protein D
MNRFAIPLKVCKIATAVALGAALVCSTVPVPVFAKESASKLFKLGQTAEAREDYDAAYEAYRKAYAKAPNDLRYRTAYYRLRQVAGSVHVTDGRKLMDKGDEQGALSQFLRAKEIDPGNEAAIQEIAHLQSRQTGVPIRSETSLSDAAEESIEDAGAPAELKAVSNEPLTLHMTQDSKVIY